MPKLHGISESLAGEPFEIEVAGNKYTAFHERINTNKQRMEGWVSTYIEKGKNPNHEIILGWDSSLNTYFLHVIDQAKEENEEGRDVLWVGRTLNEILDLDVLEQKALKYMQFPGELWTKLYVHEGWICWDIDVNEPAECNQHAECIIAKRIKLGCPNCGRGWRKEDLVQDLPALAISCGRCYDGS